MQYFNAADLDKERKDLALGGGTALSEKERSKEDKASDRKESIREQKARNKKRNETNRGGQRIMV
jgi:hypothetical protein